MFPFNYLQGAIVAIATAAIAFGLHSLSVSWIEVKHEKQLTAQAASLKKECDAEKKITEEVSYELQNKISDLDRRANEFKRLRPDCIPIITHAASRDNDAKGDAGFSGSNEGVNSEALFDFAADAERVGLQLDACQGFIKKTWALKEK